MQIRHGMVVYFCCSAVILIYLDAVKCDMLAYKSLLVAWYVVMCSLFVVFSSGLPQYF